MKVLVTGCAGFIGSHLTETLLNKGYYVKGLDNFSTGLWENIKDILDHPDFHLTVGDIRDWDTCRKAAEDCDYVFHQAALGSVPRSIDDPITTNEVNVGGFLKMLVAARDAKVKRFIFASSSSVYGDANELPKREDNIGKPISPYAVSKFTDELYADVFAKTYGLEFIGLRYFNVFGPRQNPKGTYAQVIPLFITQILNGETPVINGDGETSRDFTYIDNIVHANLLAMSVSNPEAVNQVYNVATSTRVSINSLYKEILSSLPSFPRSPFGEDIGGPPSPLYRQSRPGDMRHTLGDISKAQSLLGYTPLVDFQEGITKTIAWFTSH